MQDRFSRTISSSDIILTKSSRKLGRLINRSSADQHATSGTTAIGKGVKPSVQAAVEAAKRGTSQTAEEAKAAMRTYMQKVANDNAKRAEASREVHSKLDAMNSDDLSAIAEKHGVDTNGKSNTMIRHAVAEKMLSANANDPRHTPMK